jgi:hypothetical protein
VESRSDINAHPYALSPSRCCAGTRKLYIEKRVPVFWFLPALKTIAIQPLRSCARLCLLGAIEIQSIFFLLNSLPTVRSRSAGAEGAYFQILVQRNHLREKLQNVLRHRIFVDADQSFRFRVELEAFVEAQRSRNGIGSCKFVSTYVAQYQRLMRTISSKALAVRYLLHEERFPLLKISREAFFQRLFNCLFDFILLLLLVYFRLLFGKLCLSP